MNQESNQKWLISDKHPFRSYCRAVNGSEEEEKGEESHAATTLPFSCKAAPARTHCRCLCGRTGFTFVAKIVERGKKN